MCAGGRGSERLQEECRVPVGRPDFKSGRGCQQSLVGSTPILFRQLTSLVDLVELSEGLDMYISPAERQPCDTRAPSWIIAQVAARSTRLSLSVAGCTTCRSGYRQATNRARAGARPVCPCHREIVVWSRPVPGVSPAGVRLVPLRYSPLPLLADQASFASTRCGNRLRGLGSSNG